MTRQKTAHGGIQWDVLLPPEQREYIDYRFQRMYKLGGSTFNPIYEELATARQKRIDSTRNIDTIAPVSRPSSPWAAYRNSRESSSSMPPMATTIYPMLDTSELDPHEPPLLPRKPASGQRLGTTCWEGPAQSIVFPLHWRTADKSKIRRLRLSRQRWNGVFLLRTLRHQ